MMPKYAGRRPTAPGAPKLKANCASVLKRGANSILVVSLVHRSRQTSSRGAPYQGTRAPVAQSYMH
jgi:hypothetical protein